MDINWDYIYNNYNKACFFFYHWAEKEDVVMDFTKKFFIKFLMDNNYFDNSDRLFMFFDQYDIRCGVFPSYDGMFISFVASETNTILCEDEPTRIIATTRTVQNAFEVLNKRVTKVTKAT
jgi:hypothetical protein